VGAVGGVRADRRLPPSPALLRQLGEGQLGGGDVVGSGVRACVSRSEEGGDRLTGSARAVVDESRQRVMPVGLLPGRRCVLLVRMRDHEDAVEVDRDLSVGVRGVLARQRPGPAPDFGPRGPDGLQAALARTYSHWDGITNKQLADAYLRRVMINTRTEWWRTKKLEEVPTEQMPDASVEDSTEQHANRALLTDLLKTLPPNQRRVVVLRTWEQMSTEETAAVLVMAAGTVKSTLHRALTRLRVGLQRLDLDPKQ
jgi:RNA polymerase sigma-70 factor (sigma-E family)